jgi:hypothetical protein
MLFVWIYASSPQLTGCNVAEMQLNALLPMSKRPATPLYCSVHDRPRLFVDILFQRLHYLYQAAITSAPAQCCVQQHLLRPVVV